MKYKILLGFFAALLVCFYTLLLLVCYGLFFTISKDAATVIAGGSLWQSIVAVALSALMVVAMNRGLTEVENLTMEVLRECRDWGVFRAGH